MPTGTPVTSPAKPSGSTTATGANLSATEVQMMASILTQLPQPLSVDWARIAQELGYSNPRVASTRWAQIKKNKLGISGGSTSAQSGSPTGGKSVGGAASKAVTPRKRKAGKDASGEHEGYDDEEREETLDLPSPKRKKAKKEGDVVVKDEEGEIGVDDLLSV